MNAFSCIILIFGLASALQNVTAFAIFRLVHRQAIHKAAAVRVLQFGAHIERTS
jgi:hypothetical protein